MLAGTGNRHAVEQFKKLKIQGFQNGLWSAFLCRKFAPACECPLCLAKYFFDTVAGLEFGGEVFRFPLISERKLVTQVRKSIVYRRCRQHENFCFHASAYDLVHEALITGLALLFAGGVVAKVV